MRIIDIIILVLSSFRNNILRFILTLLGVVIGSASLIFLASFLESGKNALKMTSQQISGANIITISEDRSSLSLKEKTKKQLNFFDVFVLSKALKNYKIDVTGEINIPRVDISYRGKKKQVSIVSINSITQELYGLEVEKGRLITKNDNEEGKRVCLIGNKIYKQFLDSPQNIKDLSIIINNNLFKVVGVLKPKPILGKSSGVWMWDQKVAIPENTVKSYITGNNFVQNIYAILPYQNLDKDFLKQIRQVIDGILFNRHYNVKSYKIDDNKQKENQEKMIANIVYLLIYATSIISLIVGGINIMNIMLITIRQRSKEIGIRMALGASKIAILKQFLLESSIIGSLGGIIGIIFGILGSYLLSLILKIFWSEWDFTIVYWSVILSYLFSVVTGVIFGIYPAYKASSFSPVECCLRE